MSTVCYELFSFTDAEEIFYSRVYDTCRETDEEVATVGSVTTLLRTSNLSNDSLAELWDLVDRGNKGYLTRVEFYVALRGVALLQMDPEAITVDKLETTELPLERLARVTTPVKVSQEDVEVSKRKRLEARDSSSQKVSRDDEYCVRVKNPRKVETKLKSYIMYELHVHCTYDLFTDDEGNVLTDVVVEKRFSDLDRLREQMLKEAPGRSIPPLPPKSVSKSTNDKFVQELMEKMTDFLNRMLADKHLRRSPALVAFLRDETVVKVVTKRRRISRLLKAKTRLRMMRSTPSSVDAQLQHFSSHLEQLSRTIHDCIRAHKRLADEFKSQVIGTRELMMLMPSCLPLSSKELDGYAKEMSNDEHDRVKVMDEQLSKWEAVMRDIKSMKEAVRTVRKAFIASQSLSSKDDPQRIEEAKRTYEEALKRLEEGMDEFESVRQHDLGGLVKSVADVHRKHGTLRMEWWQALQKRAIFASESTLPSQVDVPQRLFNFRELSWFPAELARKDEKQMVTEVIDGITFAPGQEAAETLPCPSKVVPEEGESEGLVVASSMGHVAAADGVAPGDLGSSLPAYVFASGTDGKGDLEEVDSRQGHLDRVADDLEQGALNDIPTDALFIPPPEPQLTGKDAIPAHWGAKPPKPTEAQGNPWD